MSPIAVEAVALRSGTSADWAATNLVLGLGELGADTDTGTLKLGDGVTPWADLPASGGGGGLTQPTAPNLGSGWYHSGFSVVGGAVDNMPVKDPTIDPGDIWDGAGILAVEDGRLTFTAPALITADIYADLTLTALSPSPTVETPNALISNLSLVPNGADFPTVISTSTPTTNPTEMPAGKVVTDHLAQTSYGTNRPLIAVTTGDQLLPSLIWQLVAGNSGTAWIEVDIRLVALL